MSKISSGANYIQRDSSTSKRIANVKKSPIGVIFSAFFALVLMVMTAQPLFSALQNDNLNTSSSLPVVLQTEAAGISFICSENMGAGMNSRGEWKSFLSTPPQYNAANRSWTAEEAFGSNISFVNYHGEGEGNNYFVADKKEPKLDKLSKEAKEAYTKNADKFKGLRTASNCVNQTVGTSVANIVIKLAAGATGVTKAIVTFAFDSNVVCDKPTDKGACINLLKVIGGTGSSSGGIIGALTSGIYMPLLVIMATITGFWILKIAFKDKKYREALFGFIWLVVSVILGLAMLLNPSLLAKAPMAVSNSVASCVIGSFNGQNCFTNKSTNSSIDINDTNVGAGSKNICKSEASGLSLDENMSLAVNSLSCSIWKAFVLEPLAQGNFGTSVENLDTTSSSPTSAVIKKAGLDPKDFCINLSSSASASSMEGKRLNLDGSKNQVCNLLVYQGYLQTNAKTSSDKIGPPSNNSGQDVRWYNIATVAATDSGMWNQWGSSYSGGMHKTGIALLALFTSFLGGFILIVVAIFALIYYFSGILLMAFAPIFLLIGVHPGRGKKILFGWLEKVISNVVKYIISAAFLIVAIALYAAVLGNASNIGATLVFILILSGALFLYRKELIDLIGKTNMGGEQISSKLSERLGGMVKGTAKLGAATAGAGLGAGLAGGRVSSGMKDGFKRSLQRGDANEIFGKGLGGVVTQATRQYSRNVVDNAQDIKTKAREEASKRDALKSQFDAATTEEASLATEISRVDNDSAIKQVELDRASKTESVVSDVNNEVAREMQADNPYFGQAMLMLEQLKALKLDLRIARINGDEDEMRRINGEIESITSQRAQLMDQIPENELRGLGRKYKNETIRRYSLNGVEDYNPRDRVAYEELVGSTYKDQAYRDDLVDRANKASQNKLDLEAQWLGANGVAELYRKADIDRQPGDDFNSNFVEKLDKEAEKLREDALTNTLDKGPKLYENKDLYDLGITSYRGPDSDGGYSDRDYDGGDDNPNNSGGYDSRINTEIYPQVETYDKSESETIPTPIYKDDKTNDSSSNPEVENWNEYDKSNYREYDRDEKESYEDYDSERENYYSGKYDEEMNTPQAPEASLPDPVRPQMKANPVIEEDILPEFNDSVNIQPSRIETRGHEVDYSDEVLPDYSASQNKPTYEKPSVAQENVNSAPRVEPVAIDSTPRENTENIKSAVNENKFRQDFAEELNKMSSDASRDFAGTKFEKEFEQIYGRLDQISRSDSGDLSKIQSELEKVSLASDRLQDKINNSSPEDLGPVADQMRAEIDNRVSELFDQKSSRISSQQDLTDKIKVEPPLPETSRVESVEPKRSEPVRPESVVNSASNAEQKIPQSVIDSAVNEAVRNATKNIDNAPNLGVDSTRVEKRSESKTEAPVEMKRSEQKTEEPKASSIPSRLIDEAVERKLKDRDNSIPRKENVVRDSTISKEQYEDIRKSIISEMNKEIIKQENKYKERIESVTEKTREISELLENTNSSEDFDRVQNMINKTENTSISKSDYRLIMGEIDRLKDDAQSLPNSIQSSLINDYDELKENFEKAVRAKNDQNRAKNDASAKIRKIDSDYRGNPDVDETVRIKPVNNRNDSNRPNRNPRGGLPINPNID